MQTFNSPSLLELLQRQPPGRREQIAQHWSCSSSEAVALHRHMIGDQRRCHGVVGGLLSKKAVKNLLVDLVQEYGLPVTMYPEDRVARRELAERGLIYPFAVEDRGRAQRSAWVMPLEVAILCAQFVEIYRLGLPLLLGKAGAEAVSEIRAQWGLISAEGTSFVEEVIDLSAKLADRQWLAPVLYDPAWSDQTFTLQVVLEWSGICHRPELFSYAWGDDKLRPLAGRGHQANEREVESSLYAYGLLFEYKAPNDCSDPQCEVHQKEGESQALIVLPEEIRGSVWKLGREVQEHALAGMLNECGGWSATRRTSPLGLPVEPVDHIKALACVLESASVQLTEEGDLEDISCDALASLTPEGDDVPSWQSLVNAGLVSGVFVRSNEGSLAIGPAGARILDEQPPAFSRTLLGRWVLGAGPHSIDAAQNRALGLSATWLKEVSPLLGHTSAEVHVPWWRYLEEGGALAQLPTLMSGKKSARFRPRRPLGTRAIPTWLSRPGVVGDSDFWCGYPRPENQRKGLPAELLLLESIVTTFRLLILDLLRGLPRKQPIAIESIAVLLQESAAYAIHLGLAALVVDPASQLFIPMRPPSYLVESSSDEDFNQLADVFIDALLVPAGAAIRQDGQFVCLWPSRLMADTPMHVDPDARFGVLAAITGIELDEVSTPPTHLTHPLRSVATGNAETERSFWLGRPLGELRRAVAGRRVTALHRGYLEVAGDE